MKKLLRLGNILKLQCETIQHTAPNPVLTAVPPTRVDTECNDIGQVLPCT